HRKGFASPNRLHLRSRYLLIAQRTGDRICSALGQKLVELLGARTVGEAFDAYPGLGIAHEELREALDGELSTGLQSRLAGVKKDISHGDDHASIRLLRLKVRE